jgi:hypothetical protein
MPVAALLMRQHRLGQAQHPGGAPGGGGDPQAAEEPGQELQPVNQVHPTLFHAWWLHVGQARQPWCAAIKCDAGPHQWLRCSMHKSTGASRS